MDILSPTKRHNTLEWQDVFLDKAFSVKFCITIGYLGLHLIYNPFSNNLTLVSFGILLVVGEFVKILASRRDSTSTQHI